jgi:hypothetical protein
MFNKDLITVKRGPSITDGFAVEGGVGNPEESYQKKN